MGEIVRLEKVTQYNTMRGVETLHPLLTVLDLSKAKPMPARRFHFGLYAVYLKELNCGDRFGTDIHLPKNWQSEEQFWLLMGLVS